MVKIINPDYAGEMSIQEAVIFAVTPECYMCSGELDKLKQTNENLTKLVARLVEAVCHNTIELEKILGHGFEVRTER